MESCQLAKFGRLGSEVSGCALEDCVRLTVVVIVAAAVLLGAYDLWTLSARGVATTISDVTRLLGHKYSIIPFALGVVFGHIFW